MVKRGHRPSWQDESRRNLYLTIGFGLTVLAALVLLIAAPAVLWYQDTYGEVASVNGQTITRSELQARYEIEIWRIEESISRIRNELAAGRVSQGAADQQIGFLGQRREQADQLALARLIDGELQSQLAVEEGISVSEADIDARLVEEATRMEQRHVWVIAVEPELHPDATGPTDEQVAAAKAKIEAAAKDLAAGKAWEDVAATVSTDPSRLQGGDFGWVIVDGGLDEAFDEAIFAAPLDTPTAVVEGKDGIFRIGRVTEIAEEQVDPNYQQKILDAKIGLTAYREAVRVDIVRERLEDMIVTAAVETPSLQRRVSEIYIAEQGTAGDQVKVRHVLYAPNDDPQAAGDLPTDDPAWKAAEDAARATYEELKALTGEPLETAFTEAAKQDSDEPGADSSGGELSYYGRDQLDRAFGDAVFAGGLRKGDLLEPVQSAFGWHVILFEDRRGPPEQRIQGATIRVSVPGASFDVIARAVSEGPEKDAGGEIGWIARGQLETLLEEAIYKAPLGGLSEAVNVAGDGWYLFKVWEEQSRLPDAEQAAKLRDTAFANWYDEKRKAATVTSDLVPELGNLTQ